MSKKNYNKLKIKKIIIIVIVFLVIIFGFMLIKLEIQNIKQKKTIQNLEESLNEISTENYNLENDLSNVEDESYLEKIARERDYVKPGERVYYDSK